MELWLQLLFGSKIKDLKIPKNFKDWNLFFAGGVGGRFKVKAEWNKSSKVIFNFFFFMQRL